jgi:hypothetical protein
MFADALWRREYAVAISEIQNDRRVSPLQN